MMKKTRIPVLALVLSIVFILCAALPAGAVQFGTPDDSNHPYVVMCVFDVELPDGTVVPAWRTTGFLISPYVVITAGHGTDGTVGGRVTNSPDIPEYLVDGYPFPGPWAIEAAAIYTHPLYRTVTGPGNGLPQFDSYDVGIVILSEPIVLAEYAELPDANLVETLDNMAGVDLVGYGVNEQQKGGGVSPYDAWTWERMRYYAPANIVPGQGRISDMFVKVTANPGRGKGGTTFGDSGGPILLAGTNIVIANNSFVTNVNCDGVTYAQRMDIPAVLDWIAGTICPP
jgi:hypothetical protein